MPEPGAVLATIIASCDGVFMRAPVTFTRRVIDEDTVVYRADPVAFARAYPLSGIEEDYGPQWPPYDINFWVEFRKAERRIRVVAEGWQQRDRFLDLTADASMPALKVALYFERLLLATATG